MVKSEALSSNIHWHQFTFPEKVERSKRTSRWKATEKLFKLIYIHVLRYLVASKGLFWPLLVLTGVRSSSVVFWFVALLLSLKLRVRLALLARQDAFNDRWLFPFKFLVQCWLAAVVVDCKRRLSDVVMFVSSVTPGTVRLLLLNEFIER